MASSGAARAENHSINLPSIHALHDNENPNNNRNRMRTQGGRKNESENIHGIKHSASDRLF